MGRHIYGGIPLPCTFASLSFAPPRELLSRDLEKNIFFFDYMCYSKRIDQYSKYPCFKLTNTNSNCVASNSPFNPQYRPPLLGSAEPQFKWVQSYTFGTCRCKIALHLSWRGLLDFGTNYRRCICSIVKKSFLIGRERDGGFIINLKVFYPLGFVFKNKTSVMSGNQSEASRYAGQQNIYEQLRVGQ